MIWMSSAFDEFDPMDCERIIGELVQVTVETEDDEDQHHTTKQVLGHLKSVTKETFHNGIYVRFDFKDGGYLCEQGPSSVLTIETTPSHDKHVAKMQELVASFEERPKPGLLDRTLAHFLGRE